MGTLPRRQAVRCALREGSKALVTCAVSLEATHDPHMAHASPHVCIAEIRSVSCNQHADSGVESVPDSVVLKGRYRCDSHYYRASTLEHCARRSAMLRLPGRLTPGPAPMHVSFIDGAQGSLAFCRSILDRGICCAACRRAVFVRSAPQHRHVCRARELRRWRSSYSVAARLRARVDAECAVSPTPAPFTRSETYWHAGVARSFDVNALDQRARALFKALSPGVKAPCCLRPDKLSYFLINAVGVPANERYSLFCVPTAVLRLQQVCHLRHGAEPDERFTASRARTPCCDSEARAAAL